MDKSFQRLVPYRTLSTALCLSFLQAGVLAQEHPGCFGVFSSGQTSNLDPLCVRKIMQPSNQPSSQTEEAQALYQEGFRKAQGRNFREAITNFSQAISLSPDFSLAYIGRAYAQGFLKQYRESIQDFEKAAEIYTSTGQTQRAKSLQPLIQELRDRIKN